MNQDITQDPKIQQAVAQAVDGLEDNLQLTPQVINAMVKMFEYVLKHPEAYPDLLKSALDSNMMEPGDMPEQFDPTAVTVILMAMKILQGRVSQKDTKPEQFARGGLSSLAAKGRRGDSELAHVNPFEARVLKSYGGAGIINPNTGLREYGILGDIWDGIKGVVKAVAPILAVVAAPYLAPMLGGGLMGAMGAGAITGGLSSAIGGGDILKGALTGGLGGGLTGGLAGDIGGYLAPSLSGATQQMIGSGLVGGLSGAATGQGFAQGAVGGALGSALGNQVSSMGGTGAVGEGIRQGGQTLGNLMTMGANPRDALLGGALAGVATGMGYGPNQKPSEIATSQLGSGLTPGRGDTGLKADYSLTGETPAGYAPGDVGSGLTPPAGGAASPTTSSPFSSNFGLNQKTLGMGLGLMSMLGSAQTPQQVQQGVSSMSPEQKEYFNRVTPTWDWAKLQQDASKNSMSLGQYIATNWNNMTAGNYNLPTKPRTNGFADGGLNALARLAAGGGSGREDTIDAKLSDGEYVFDAETTALIGDGSVKEGARRLDEMRQRIRQHKGKMLARGKISPDAKSPLEYLKGVA